MTDLTGLVDQLSGLTVLEAAELSRMLEQHWGVSAAQPAAVAGPVAVVAPVVEEQTEFSVILAAVADASRKINVIKEIRAITGLGLKEAKEFTEAAGPDKLVKDSLTKVEAEALIRRLEEAGGKAMLQ